MEKTKIGKVKVANALKLLKIHEDWRALCVGIYRMPGTVRTSISLQSFIFKRDRKATREDTEQAYLQGNERIFTQTKGAPLTIRPMIDELYYRC